MSDNTAIEWADATANYVSGCDPISPGCTNCFAMHSGGRNLPGHPSTGLTRPTRAGHVWTGEIRVVDKWLETVLRWRKPRRIFWNSHGDLFHEAVPDEVIDRQFAVMGATPQHIHMVLTKRPERMREYIESLPERQRTLACDPELDWHFFPLPNVWLGTSVEDQTRANERIPDLLATPAAIRFVSVEPLLGPVDLTEIQFRNVRGGRECYDALDLHLVDDEPMPPDVCDGILDWVIVGGESGPNARPMHPDWVRRLRDQCAAADVPFFFKQWGEWEVSLDRERDDPDWRADYTNDYVDRGKSKWLNLKGGSGFHGERFHVMRRVGKKRAGRLLDGVQHDAFPGGAS